MRTDLHFGEDALIRHSTEKATSLHYDYEAKVKKKVSFFISIKARKMFRFFCHLNAWRRNCSVYDIKSWPWDFACSDSVFCCHTTTTTTTTYPNLDRNESAFAGGRREAKKRICKRGIPPPPPPFWSTVALTSYWRSRHYKKLFIAC